MVWFSCLILVILSTILLHLTISSSSDENRSINHQKRITDSVLSMVACVCQMDSSVRSSVTSSRIIMVSYSEFFIFISLYSNFIILFSHDCWHHNTVLHFFDIFIPLFMLYCEYCLASSIALTQYQNFGATL